MKMRPLAGQIGLEHDRGCQIAFTSDMYPKRNYQNMFA